MNYSHCLAVDMQSFTKSHDLLYPDHQPGHYLRLFSRFRPGLITVHHGYFNRIDHPAAELGPAHAQVADGLQAVEWYKQGKIDKIIEYCLMDVEITRDVFTYGMKNGHIKIAKADGDSSTVRVQWS